MPKPPRVPPRSAIFDLSIYNYLKENFLDYNYHYHWDYLFYFLLSTFQSSISVIKIMRTEYYWLFLFILFYFSCIRLWVLNKIYFVTLNMFGRSMLFPLRKIFLYVYLTSEEFCFFDLLLQKKKRKSRFLFLFLLQRLLYVRLTSIYLSNRTNTQTDLFFQHLHHKLIQTYHNRLRKKLVILRLKCCTCQYPLLRRLLFFKRQNLYQQQAIWWYNQQHSFQRFHYSIPHSSTQGLVY